LKLIVAISGASGVHLGLKFLEKLPKEIQTFVILSKSAKKTLKLENQQTYKQLYSSVHTVLNNNDIGACVASGSFGANAMIILPCSMNTLAKCATGMADNLITRAFSVMLKEQRRVVIAPREIPYNPIALEHMLTLSKLGIFIAAPNLGYYSNQQTLEDMENFLIGKWFDLLNIENNLYERWK
jgi:4-hydroxy-3-polyprenylbenzoate decarboxylase